MDARKLYNYIASANSFLSASYIGRFLSLNPECNGALEYLIEEGYVKEKEGLYGITNKPFEEADGPDTDWGRGDRDHLEYYDDDYER